MTQLIKLVVMDKNILRCDNNFSFSISHELCALKQKRKITDSELHAFRMVAKNFVSTLYNHLILKSELTSCFVQCPKSLNLINMAEMSDVCEKAFHRMLHRSLSSDIARLMSKCL